MKIRRMEVKNRIKTIPLLIKDIKKLEINPNTFGKNLIAFGIEFDCIIIYGTCYPSGVDKKNKLKLLIDDGTGIIGIKLPINKNENIENTLLSLESTLQKVKSSYTLQNKPLNTYDNGRQHLWDSMNRLLKEARKQSHPIDIDIKMSTSVAVLGVPYKIVASNEIWIHAYDVLFEYTPNRDTEIFFKNSLIEWYRSIL